MQITLNGKPAQVESATLAGLLTELNYAESRVATAVNGSFVPRPKRTALQLQEHDKVEILTPRHGG